MNIKELNEEVLFSNDKIINVSYHDIEILKQKALSNKRKRIRLCSHDGPEDKLHEMLIIHAKGVYVRPHRHLGKTESLHVIEGAADAVIYDETGSIIKVIEMGDYASGKSFYYRIAGPEYHNLIIKTEFFVFHETTSGPFNRADTVFAPWSPDEHDYDRVKKFTKDTAEKISSFKVSGKGIH